jgi:hypothetical protein
MQPFGAPEIFSTWAGIATIAAALERKTWVYTRGSNLFPNMYCFLIGLAGSGKTQAIKESARLMRLIQPIIKNHLSPNNVSKASLMDALGDARRDIIQPGKPFIEYNSLYAPINELGVLLPAYDHEMMSALTDIWDGEPYIEKKRHMKNKDGLNIPRPQLNIIGGTTPAWIGGFMPEGAWDEGFISRVIMVYSSQSDPVDIFTDSSPIIKKQEALVHDLIIIAKLYGQMLFETEAQKQIREWVLARNKPEPEHPRLYSYNARRTAHLLKLSMVATAARSNDLIITKADYETAYSWMLEAENNMPDIFKSMRTGADTQAIENVWYFVMKQYAKESRPIAEQRIIALLSEQVASHQIMKIVEIMTRSGMILPEIVRGITCYKPGGKKQY